MKTMNSISGGKTSAYMAAHYPADYNIFALVRIEDPRCAPKDPILKREAEERTGKPFIATAEEDETMYAVLDLEQYIGQRIEWVTGPTFEEAIANHSDYLPNKRARYCTTDLKIAPLFYWWAKNVGEPVEQRIGYRANEVGRAKTKLQSCNADGLAEFKATFDKMPDGRNKWEIVAWFRPRFPLIEDGVFKWEIENYWEGKPVRFARMNNCAGCWWRSPVLLRKQFDHQPEKMNWFANQEESRKGTWRSDVSYREIEAHRLQLEVSIFVDMFADDLDSCESGYCGL